MIMLNKKRENKNELMDIYYENLQKKYDDLRYKYDKVISENVAIKMELKAYKSIIHSKIFEGIKNEIKDENKKREDDIFKENLLLNLNQKIKEKEMEIEKLKGLKKPILETPIFNKEVDDKMINDAFISLSLYKSLKIIQFYAMKNSVEKIGVTYEKTVSSILNLNQDEIKRKDLTIDEIGVFAKYYPMLANFVRQNVEKECDALKSSNLLGKNIRKICEIINDIMGNNYIKDSEMKNLESFSNKIIK